MPSSYLQAHSSLLPTSAGTSAFAASWSQAVRCDVRRVLTPFHAGANL
jgi:hypothetical protein